MTADNEPATQAFAVLDAIVQRNQTWPIVSAKYDVENPLPPWKTSLDGLCDALDKSCSEGDASSLTLQERRDEEDTLSTGRYADLPYPESQLVSLSHSLLARGVIDEATLTQRLALIRARLEAH